MYSLSWNGYQWVKTLVEINGVPLTNYGYKQQESNMQVAVNTQHDEALEHLVTRLNKVTWNHRDKLREHYHCRERYPDDEKQAKEWFDKGFFSYNDTMLRWGPKADYDGFNASMDKVYRHKELAEDTIRVKTDEDARLKALHDFESATFH